MIHVSTVSNKHFNCFSLTRLCNQISIDVSVLIFALSKTLQMTSSFLSPPSQFSFPSFLLPCSFSFPSSSRPMLLIVVSMATSHRPHPVSLSRCASRQLDSEILFSLPSGDRTYFCFLLSISCFPDLSWSSSSSLLIARPFPSSCFKEILHILLIHVKKK